MREVEVEKARAHASAAHPLAFVWCAFVAGVGCCGVFGICQEARHACRVGAAGARVRVVSRHAEKRLQQ